MEQMSLQDSRSWSVLAGDWPGADDFYARGGGIRGRIVGSNSEVR
jgi:hypothetical protein